MPLLGERLKKLPESQVENYIRRVVNLEDTTPITDTLNVTQAKRVLDFIGQQENANKISPPKFYRLIERIINDGKISSSQSYSNNEGSFSRLFEKHRIEQNINQVLNKIEDA